MVETTSEIRTDNPLSHIKYAVATDIGRRREENQDYYGIIEGENYKYLIVADGMGGAKGGATASRLAINVVADYINQADILNEDTFSLAIQRANIKIFEKGASDENLAGMGTTFVGLAFVGKELYITSVGDSRGYLIRNAAIRQLTADHTLVMELVRSGALTLDQIENHPVAHMLTRSLGPTPEVAVDSFHFAEGAIRGDIFLLCSDGLYNLVEEDEMVGIVQENEIESAVKKLVDLANKRGGTDNITVILIKMGDGYPREVSETTEPTMPPQDIILEEEYLAETQALERPLEVESEISKKEDHGGINGHGLNGGHEEKADWEQVDSPQVRLTKEIHSEVEEIPVSQDEPLLESSTIPSIDSVRSEAVKSAQFAAWRIPVKSWMFSGRTAMFGFLLLGVFFGIAIANRGFFFEGTEPGVVVEHSSSPLVASVARNEAELETASHSPQVAPLSSVTDSGSGSDGSDVVVRESATTLPGTQLQNESTESQYPGSSVHDVASDGGLTVAEIEDIIHRKVGIRERLSDIEAKLQLFDKPISGDFAARLKDSELRKSVASKDLEKIQGDLDIATRKLAIWYGRRQKISSVDPVDLASEVAVTSEDVKEKKDGFEHASWSYLKAVEVWRYNPSDPQLTENLKKLGRIRSQKRRDLAVAVRESIDKSVGESDQLIAELSVKKDRLQNEVDRLTKEIQFSKVITGSNERAKFEIQQEFRREKEVIKSELEELDHLVPAEREAVLGEKEAVEVKK